jgi:hypothetical protein
MAFVHPEAAPRSDTAPGVQIFSIVVPALGTMAVKRLSSAPGGYMVTVAGRPWIVSPETAMNLASVTRKVERHLRAPPGDDKKIAGSLYSADGVLNLSIDDDGSISIEWYDLPKVRLTGENVTTFLWALKLFERDLIALRRGSGKVQQMAVRLAGSAIFDECWWYDTEPGRRR